MGSIAGGSSYQKISVGNILREVLKCETEPVDYRVHELPRRERFLVQGNLFGNAAISPYTWQLPLRRDVHWHDPFAKFEVTGVIEDHGDLLAFRYQHTDNLPTPDERTIVKFKQEKRLTDLISGMTEAAETEYIHLRAALTHGQPHLYLCGTIKNNSPRIFLVEGMVVEAPPNARRTRHGSYFKMNNEPSSR